MRLSQNCSMSVKQKINNFLTRGGWANTHYFSLQTKVKKSEKKSLFKEGEDPRLGEKIREKKLRTTGLGVKSS